MPDPVSHTLDVPGAVLTYDVRGDLADQPVLLMIGSPMGASGFPTLASHFADRTVVTYDPRGTERSTRSDGAGELSPDDHARDLAALIEAVPTVANAGHYARLVAEAARRRRVIDLGIQLAHSDADPAALAHLAGELADAADKYFAVGAAAEADGRADRLS